MAIETKQSAAADEQQTESLNENPMAEEITNDDNGENDITPEELDLLNDAGINEEPGDDDDELEQAQLDDVDEDGDKLNEDNDLTGEDLDVPGTEIDDADELIGEEDEENNSFSSSDQEDDDDDVI